ncbi:D-glycerate dehydrogenase [Tepidiforma sp.]|uniref:2-hydroxyacid dehydrogenase n=1 Tax=Tepidiforma sp. TaxID=2682230 RepID=UPI002ADE5149|nr:D-glycerate dehydrogenase [Tepidiforma sp.]
MARIFLTRTLPGKAASLLESEGHTVETWPGELPPPAPDLAAALARSDAAITTVVDRITPDMLAAAPGLRIVANMAVGYDNIDPAAAAGLGIWVTNTPGILAETTADMAWALLMAAARRVVESDRDTRAGGWKTWSPTGYLGIDVYGATLGIIGLGEIGEAVARRARGFSMRTIYHSRTPKPALEAELGLARLPLHDLLEQADFISLHVPLTPETRRLLGPAEFARIKPGAILINTSRGQVIDQDALVAALRSGRLRAAALDVTDPEPLPLEHPLFGFPNVIITPHIASASEATRARMAEAAALNVLAVLADREPPTPVNRPAKPRS